MNRRAFLTGTIGLAAGQILGGSIVPNREAVLMSMLHHMETTEEYRAFMDKVNFYLAEDIRTGTIQALKASLCPPQRNLCITLHEGPPQANQYDLFRVMRSLRPNGKLRTVAGQYAEFGTFVQLAKDYVF